MAQTIDDAVIVSHGQLKAQGTLESITAGVAQASMHARTPEADRLCAVLTDAGVRFRRLTVDLVAVDGMTPEQLGPLLATNQIILYELTNEGADLESIFLSLTSGLGFGEMGQPA
jgi:ABC-2 type transport system ATP-binding protein